MEPDEFRALAQALRDVAAMLGGAVDKTDLSAYREMKTIFEKSIVLAHGLPAGAALRKEDLAFKKPGDGIPAAEYARVLGRTLAGALPKDHQLAWSDLREP